MADDIVERLLNSQCDMAESRILRNEAADEIKRLRAELSEEAEAEALACVAWLAQLETTPAQRARIRELAESGAMDDYDRSVIELLNDFEKCVALIAILGDYAERKIELTDGKL